MLKSMVFGNIFLKSLACVGRSRYLCTRFPRAGGAGRRPGRAVRGRSARNARAAKKSSKKSAGNFAGTGKGRNFAGLFRGKRPRGAE